ncbi:MAG: 3-oxoacyl-[acyl-carrier-protein] synthase III C-terminal domain-containing protein [Planctomycetota bacterium]
MHLEQHFRIAGTGHYRPQTVLSCEAVDQRLGKPLGWAASNSGVTDRRECLPHESLAGMAQAAIDAAMRDAGVGWDSIDLLIDCSNSRQQPVPCNAALVQAAIGKAAAGVPCFDVQSTCLGFLVALQVANGLLASRGFKTILIVCSEAPLSGVDWSEPESASLMSDAAAAVVVVAQQPTPTLLYAHETHAQHAAVCEVRGGGHNLLPFDYRSEIDGAYRFHMDGPRLFRIARKLLPPMVEALIQESGVERSDLFVIPHQASPRAVEVVRRVLRFNEEQYVNRVPEFGNTVAASVPLTLDVCRHEGRIADGDSVLLLGTSAGYSQAAMVFQA